ncbi:MAG: hypothetical protein IBJ15_02145 [Alphaproteobacteria bacterium]|nr:hypothetical protein [Alphaproteobacteria bacterium]
MSAESILGELRAIVDYVVDAYARATFTEIAIAFVMVVAFNVAGYFVGRVLGWREVDELHRSWAKLRATYSDRAKE